MQHLKEVLNKTKEFNINGIKVLLNNTLSNKLVTILFCIHTGSFCENVFNRGISHVIEHNVFKGTKTKKVGQISKEIEQLGGYLNAYTSYDKTCYWVTITNDFYLKALDIITDMLINPIFDEQELQKELQVIIEEIKMYNDMPEEKVFIETSHLAFDKNTLKHPIIGYEDVVESFSQKDLFNYYNKFYIPQNMLLTISGDIDTSNYKDIENILNKYYIKSQKTTNNKCKVEEEKINKGFRYLYKTDKNIKNGYIGIMYPLYDIYKDEVKDLILLDKLLTNSRSSILNYNLKEKKALVLSISGDLMLMDKGSFYYLSIKYDKNKFKYNNILDELYNLVYKEQEYNINKAKTMLNRELIISLEKTENLANFLNHYFMIFKDKENILKFFADIENMKELKNYKTFINRENENLVIYS